MQGQRCAAVRKSCRRCAAVKCPGVLLPNPPHPPPLRARTSALPSPSAPRLSSLTCTPAQRVCPPCHSPQASAGPLSPPACQHTVALAPPSLPRPACQRTSARPSVAISSSPLPPSVQAHAPQGLGPSRAHSFSPSPRMPTHFSSALGCQIILDPAPLPARPRTSGPRPIPRAPFLSDAAAGRSNVGPDRRTGAHWHSTAGPLGRRRPCRRAQAGPFVPGRRRSACKGNSSFSSC